MNLSTQISFLRRSLQVIPAMVADLTDEQVRWKPPSGNWSILEILGHLVAEEKFDFRPRVQLTLDDPGQGWPDYDPEGIVVSEKFNLKDPQETLAEFVKERSDSLVWLSGLNEDDPDWDLAHQHRRMGPLRAGDLFLSWVAHDQLHVRQIAKRCFELICDDAAQFESRYAGDW